MDNEEDLLEGIRELVEAASGLARRAVAEYAPIVDSIVRARSHDVRHSRSDRAVLIVRFIGSQLANKPPVAL